VILFKLTIISIKHRSVGFGCPTPKYCIVLLMFRKFIFEVLCCQNFDKFDALSEHLLSPFIFNTRICVLHIQFEFFLLFALYKTRKCGINIHCIKSSISMCILIYISLISLSFSSLYFMLIFMYIFNFGGFDIVAFILLTNAKCCQNFVLHKKF